jgi:hypothetical protein
VRPRKNPCTERDFDRRGRDNVQLQELLWRDFSEEKVGRKTTPDIFEKPDDEKRVPWAKLGESGNELRALHPVTAVIEGGKRW